MGNHTNAQMHKMQTDRMHKNAQMHAMQTDQSVKITTLEIEGNRENEFGENGKNITWQITQMATCKKCKLTKCTNRVNTHNAN